MYGLKIDSAWNSAYDMEKHNGFRPPRIDAQGEAFKAH